MYNVTDIDWPRWQPSETATLIFVLRGDEILLIRKKRGLGAGKINGPGGRLEAGESPEACAARELEEELGVRARSVEKRGEHRFQFVDGYALHVHVFTSEGCIGDPYETAEAIPLWTRTEAIPYEEMWEDDRFWIPHMLAGRRFSGRYVFDGDALLDYELDVVP